VWVGTKGEKVEASVDEDPKRCCCCCCGLRCRDDEQLLLLLLLLLGRAWRLCPQEVGESVSASPLSSARQIKKKKRTAANSAPRPPPPNPLSDFSQKKKLQKICADTRLRSAQTKLPHWSIGDLFSPSEASQSKRPFHAASQRVSFGLHSGQLGEIIRSALKQIAQSEGSLRCFIHSMFAVQPGRCWMAAYARTDVPH
jgi:hypothetical protein